MKSPLKFLAILFLLFIGNVVFATNGEPEFLIKKTGSKTFYFEANDKMTQPFEVKIQNKDGEVIFAEYVVDGTDFERFYNLSELPDGEYFFLLVSDSKTQTFPIWVENDDLKIEMEKLETI